MRRREFITILGSAAILAEWPLAARSQQTAKVHRIGLLSPTSQGLGIGAFRDGLRALGYLEGHNIIIEHRSADGRFDRLPDLAAELARIRVDVIVAVVTQASVAAKNATGTIPIVMLAVGDPVGAGLVTNLARPGGNVTGTSFMAVEAGGKSLELLKDVAPKLRLVGVLWNPSNPVFQTQMVNATELAARSLGIELRMFAARNSDEIERAFGLINNDRVEALTVIVDPVFIEQRAQLTGLAITKRLPSVSQFRDYAEAGGLMAYAPDFSELGRRAAFSVDKILKGAEPGDLPVEQPTKFQLVINLKTAKTLGLTVAPTLFARADEVIE